MVYLPIEDIEPFVQNGWNVRTWEPWLCQLIWKGVLTHLQTKYSKEHSDGQPKNF